MSEQRGDRGVPDVDDHRSGGERFVIGETNGEQDDIELLEEDDA